VSADSAAAPSGVVTFLFTDIEGSTRRWEADADDMRTALAAHDEVLLDAIEAQGGLVFKHTGDGVCAAFSSPRSAVDAAVEAQRRLQLPVRMGIATGEATPQGADYFGAVLNRTARVMAAGHGGQILLADSTAKLLSGVDLMNLGPQRLRDLSTSVEVFQVRGPGLRTEFPMLRSQDSGAGNLRPAATKVIGRETELKEVQEALTTHRLVTLTGVGGVGKTRLAVEVATRLSAEFPDGVWFFELAAVDDPDVVADAVAAEMRITQQFGMSMALSVANALEGRNRLLVIDNCEHVRDAVADLIEEILGRAPTVTILATSREGLGLADEQLWVVPSLDVNAGADSTAVALFVERARHVAQRFSLEGSNEDTETVVEICRRLDGIPLAIELAASRMASMTVTELRDRLDQRFRLLIGSRRGLERHQTLRHAVAWSYELLDEAERLLLARCSVFAGGFDLRSVCAVANSGFDGIDDYTVLDLLDALVRKSLLIADRSAGHTRYSMLETIRQFAEEQLGAAGSAEEARARHARYFAGREADVTALWDSPRQRAAYTWYTTELANLRSAFRWSADHDDLDTAATIASFTAFLGVMVESYEPTGWAEELIDAAVAVGHRKLASLYVVSSQCYASGRVEDALRYSLAARHIPVIDDDLPYGRAVWAAGGYLASGNPREWAALCREELASGCDRVLFTKASLAIALAVAGSLDEAVAAADGLLEEIDATDNPYEQSFILFGIGMGYRDTYPVRALDALRRSMAIAQASGNRYQESNLAATLCLLESRHGDPLATLDFVTLAIRNYHDSGNATMIPIPLSVLVVFLDGLGCYEPAATIAGFAVGPLTTAAVPDIEAISSHLRGVLGDQTYEMLTRTGAAMTMAAIVTYAYAEINHARVLLETARG
jgi:predicted ATPase/class 3 adenylate cyclase